MSGGFLPFIEEEEDDSESSKFILNQLFSKFIKEEPKDEKDRFAVLQAVIASKPQGFYSLGFMELFRSMCSRSVQKRPTFEQIRQFEWFKEPVYSQKEMEYVMKRYFVKDVQEQ
eukprot:CAMPEP_0114596400 /NCGR_PEP_ID=MMETSP0125-20121206/18386_1 /TAXON_ID=485358 ORGANISM="Aristerostoma sp., Strain ATCC 50986" /NCGR_SAMPLE_ID=MMETSP0125 /ASSEMBLY_ACC=CAM_ASM_000245 /LENGTH=113 /DNA_ID=CAMNT_0001799325 /DNA_START=767 /DNA_END=1111 /DNA_ORIENTATION=-